MDHRTLPLFGQPILLTLGILVATCTVVGIAHATDNEYRDVKVEHTHPEEPGNETKKDTFMKYLNGIYGNQTIAGFYISEEDTDRKKGIEKNQRLTGVSPGILTTEMPKYPIEEEKWQSFVNQTISNWNDGYFVYIVWGYHSSPFSKNAVLSKPDALWVNLITKGSVLNNAWKKDLDSIAPYLKELQNAGVVAIFDILPWINRNLRIWDQKPGINGSGMFYQITHDYLTQDHNLNSLIWVWSLHVRGEMTQLSAFWPGNKYVDVVSIYMHGEKQQNLTQDQYEEILKTVGGKPISMESLYSVPTLELLVNQPKWTWFTVVENYINDDKYNFEVNVNATFNSHFVVNRETNKFFPATNQKNKQTTSYTGTVSTSTSTASYYDKDTLSDTIQKNGDATTAEAGSKQNASDLTDITYITEENRSAKNATKRDMLIKFLHTRTNSSTTITGLFVTSTEVLITQGMQIIKRITGVFPWILTLEMPKNSDDKDKWQSFISETIRTVNEGHLVHIVWPTNEKSNTSIGILNDSYKTEQGYLKTIETQLKVVAPYLLQLQTAGVVAMFDILPWINYHAGERNKSSGLNRREKYRQMHDYLTINHNLSSFIWVWSLHINGSMTQLEEYWPDKNYVDVASVYIGVAKELTEIQYQEILRVVGNDTPIAMECMYNAPTPELLTNQTRWAWFTVYEAYINDARFNTKQSLNEAFNSRYSLGWNPNDFFARQLGNWDSGWAGWGAITLKHMMDYLISISGLKTIGGLSLSDTDFNSSPSSAIHRIAGVSPGILSTDMPKYSAGEDEWQLYINATIRNWKNGHMVYMTWPCDSNPISSFDSLKNAGNETAWNDLIKDGGELNELWKKYLDKLARYLKQLQTAGVVPYLDILHDINYNKCFWQGHPQDNETFETNRSLENNGSRKVHGSLKLYQITHEYFKGHHGFNFFIWVWSINIFGDMEWLKQYWPGSKYVDVVSVEMAARKQLNTTEYNNLLNIVKDKPISMCGMYSVPSPQLLAEQKRWTFFTAAGKYLTDPEYNSEENVRSAYSLSVNIKILDFQTNTNERELNMSTPSEKINSYQSTKNLSVVAIVAMACTSLVVILIVAVVAALVFKKRSRNALLMDSSFESLISNFYNGKKTETPEQTTDIIANVERQPYDTRHEISLDSIKIEWGRPLGCGAFGIVLRGELAVYVKNEADASSVLTVAVKAVHENGNGTLQAINGLMKELKILDYVGKHASIINLLGAVTAEVRQGKFYLILEYCENNSLKKYLKDHRSNYVNNSSLDQSNISRGSMICLTNADLCNWSKQIISGMEHLALKQVIHGDLATRNVLLDKSLNVELSDFGLARRLYGEAEYIKKSNEPLPWRWMAIESIRDLSFSIESDVWAFGVTLWEIFTLAETPFADETYDSEFKESLENGYRLPQQDNISDRMYTVMKSCWELDPKKRPTFGQLSQTLERIQGGSFHNDDRQGSSSPIYIDLQESIL